MAGTSVADLSGIITAGAAVATTLTGAIAFIGARVEVANKRLSKCEEDRTLGRERRAILINIIEFLTNALARHEPGAPEIHHAQQAIDELRIREDEASRK